MAVCEFDPCPSGERCFERTALGAAPYACECAPPGGIGFDCLNAAIREYLEYIYQTEVSIFSIHVLTDDNNFVIIIYH